MRHGAKDVPATTRAQIVEMLLKKGASVNAVAQVRKIITIFMRAYAHLRAQSIYIRVYIYACICMYTCTCEVMRIRIHSCPCVRAPMYMYATVILQSSGNTALHLAAQDGHMQIVQVLINGGARVDLTNKVRHAGVHYMTLIAQLAFRVRCVAVADGRLPRMRMQNYFNRYVPIWSPRENTPIRLCQSSQPSIRFSTLTCMFYRRLQKRPRRWHAPVGTSK